MLLNKRNRVIEHQKHFQGYHQTPLFLKGPRDKLYVVVASAMIAVGLVGVTNGVFRMAVGKEK
ncbi:hypothetical protein DM01DRAFT_1010950 [Hesseltinella vesiculosa]|uniref:Uncharacterized protein n=1 Tax=Hesseltinella vesiculosa TaxID=101127 RepID=A0A1X2GYF4_9FUNG|nr:hypothetical protein DM01DRAFT_1010950 [Hesseltinella vesiculosa]